MDKAMKKEKQIKGNCICGILLAAACLTASGCAASPAPGGSAVFMKEEGQLFPAGKWAEEAVLKAGREEPLLEAKPGEPQDAEIPADTEPPTEEEIQALSIPEDMLAYWMVLSSRKPFISTNEDGQKFYWDEYFWYIFFGVDKDYYAYDFMVIDMDRDGKKEVVLSCYPGTTHILHYEDGEVYGYQTGTRGMKRIHENGTYEGSGGAAVVSWHRLIRLDKDGYTSETLADMNNGYYEVQGKEATEEEFSDYMKTYIESSELAERMEFTEEMLAEQLLGNLTEQELGIVKRIPKEDMLENEPGYPEHREALQLYAGILKGEEDVIFVTEDTFAYDVETQPKYFSLADMDGDGVHELVFTCYYDVIWILHYEDGKVYGYHFRDTGGVIATDGIFKVRDASDETYARITAFGKDGCQTEPVENYDASRHERIRYYYFSEEAVARWLK